jgi:hypothetical protein
MYPNSAQPEGQAEGTSTTWPGAPGLSAAEMAAETTMELPVAVVSDSPTVPMQRSPWAPPAEPDSVAESETVDEPDAVAEPETVDEPDAVSYTI